MENDIREIDEMIAEELYPPTPERFVVDSDDKANWALRKISQARARHTAFVEQANARIKQLKGMIERIEARTAASADERDQSVGYFTALLAQYAETLPASRVKSAKTRASIAFADGRVIHKFAASKLVIRDKDKLAAALSAAKRDDLLRVKTEPAWDKIKPGVSVEQANDETVYTYTDAETGEIINLPGMGTETTPESYEIEV